MRQRESTTPIHRSVYSRTLLMTVVFVGLACTATFGKVQGAGNDSRSTLSPVPNGAAINDADLSADDSTDVHAAEELGDSIHELVYAQDYDRLEQIADSVRSRKAKFSGGLWKIHAFYSGTSSPHGHATEEDWAELQKILDGWVSAKPESITARIALANFYTNYAWDARGNGTVDTITKSGWRLFASRAQKAREVLEAAAKLKAKCPEWYVAMQQVALCQNWDRTQAKTLLEQAAAFEPEYYYYFRMYANFISPKWNGDPGESEAFAKESADQVGGEKGDILYFRIASSFMCNCEGDPQLKAMSFSRIRNGFTAAEKLYGVSLTNINLMASIATKVSEATIANALFQRIGDSWSREAWQTESYFQSCKAWAQNLAPGYQPITDNKASGEANMGTPEGQKYAAEFKQKYGAMAETCFQFSDPAIGPSELYFMLNDNGMIGKMMAFGKNPAAGCLYQLSKRTLTPPSHAPFWIKLTFEPPKRMATK
jgi:hypothetical protein